MSTKKQIFLTLPADAEKALLDEAGRMLIRPSQMARIIVCKNYGVSAEYADRVGKKEEL